MECHGLFLDKLMYTAIINVYCKNKKMTTALRVFFRMLKMGCEPDSYTYSTLIHGFVNLGLIDKAWMFLIQMEKSGFKPDVIAYHIMINKYCKDHGVDCALKLLDFMCERDISLTVHFYTVIITELSKKNRLLEVDELLTKMLNHGVVPDDVLFFKLIEKYGKNNELQLALIFLLAIAKNGCQINFSTSAADDSNADIELEIEHLLGKIVESCSSLSDIAFSIYLIALCAGGKTEAALHCMDRMTSLGCQPLRTSYTLLIKCLCQEGLVKDAMYLIEIMENRGMVIDRTTFLVMVNEHCKLGDLASAFDILHIMDERGLKPSVAMYQSIIGRLGREQRLFEAEDMFRRMHEDGVDPNEDIFVTMIKAYSRNGQAIQAQQLFDRMMEYGVRPSPRAFITLINVLVKKNMTEKACLYLNKMLEHGLLPNNVLYTSLINQFLLKREFGFAFRLVNLMENSQIELDLITYIKLASGVCRNIGCIDGKWHLAYRKSEKANEMLFHLLYQTTPFSREKKLNLPISSQKEMKLFALKVIEKIKETAFMPNVYLYNEIVSLFCWADRMQDAYNHLDIMQREGTPQSGDFYHSN